MREISFQCWTRDEYKYVFKEIWTYNIDKKNSRIVTIDLNDCRWEGEIYHGGFGFKDSAVLSVISTDSPYSKILVQYRILLKKLSSKSISIRDKYDKLVDKEIKQLYKNAEYPKLPKIVDGKLVK